MTFQNITTKDLKKKLTAGEPLLILDVRTDLEFRRRHIEDAKWIPLNELAGRYQELDPAQVTVVVCEHGVRSLNACHFLAQVGFQNIYNMLGGMSLWTGLEE